MIKTTYAIIFKKYFDELVWDLVIEFTTIHNVENFLYSDDGGNF